MDRRFLLQAMGKGIGAGLAARVTTPLGALAQDKVTLPFANGERPLVRYPGKRPLIQLTARPPQLETPFSVFNESVITPNDAFFVRYHLADIPLSIDPEAFRLEIKGHVERPLSLSLEELKKDFEPVEIVAVHQCTGNSRGFVEPRTAGGQLANGAMGNARWRGIALKSILDKAGIKAGSRQVSFNGLDKPVMPETPDFAKALDIDHAGDGEVMIAYAMNGEDIPWLNGFPIRLVVPGYYGTYWVKHLSEITVLDHAFDGYWMTTGYRAPDNACACVEPGQKPRATAPVTRFKIRSFITNLADDAKIASAKPTLVKGIAFDGGYGVTDVLLSADGGQSWREARLGEDLGRYSFREWRAELSLPRGTHELMVRAINRIGQTQPIKPLWNPPGYLHNAVETVRVHAA
jgi:sulfite dehydrogenase (cytochrome) subunit A